MNNFFHVPEFWISWRSKVMVITELIISAVLGAVFGEGFALLRSRVGNVMIEFKSILDRQEKTLDVLDPLVIDIQPHSTELDRETHDLIQQLKKGKKLVSKCLKLKGWKHVFIYYYANKLCNFDKELSTLLPAWTFEE